MTLDESQTSQLAFNVCVRCKGRKKKCDKALPSCLRCTRLHVRCRYSSSESRGLPTPPESDKVAIYQPNNINFFPELTTPFSFIAPRSILSKFSGEHRVLNLDEQLTEQCCDLMNRDGDDLLLSCSRYFSLIHAWFPIIAKEELYDRLSRLRSSPKGDFSLLVLTIHLVSQMYPHIPRERDILEQLYHTTKSFHSIFLSTGRPSIELIQAGLLLAVYEHSQALHDATYLTLGSCARMGYTLGFNKTLSLEIIPDAQANSVADRQRQVWWGIIILERISMLEYIDKKLPFAIPTPLLTDLLPSTNGSRETASQGISLHGPTPINAIVELSVHARIAQGAFLLSHVIDRVSASDPNSSSCDAAFLDNALRSYAMTLLQPSDRGHLCWPYSICLSRFEVSVEPQPSEAHVKDMFQSRAALGVRSVLRMILEGTCQLLSVSDEELTSVPIWSFHRAYLAALLGLELGFVNDDEEKWTFYIQGVKRMLQTLEPRCKLAGDYLKAIKDAESRRAQAL